MSEIMSVSTQYHAVVLVDDGSVCPAAGIRHTYPARHSIDETDDSFQAIEHFDVLGWGETEDVFYAALRKAIGGKCGRGDIRSALEATDYIFFYDPSEPQGTIDY